MARRVILFADDNEDDRMLVARAFRGAAPDVQFQTVSSGTEVLSYLKGEKEFADRKKHPLPSMVLLDLRLPPSDGLQVVRSLRSQPQFLTTVLIFLSGSGDDRALEAAYAAGANSFIRKPASFPELEAVAKLLCEYWLNCIQLPRPGEV